MKAKLEDKRIENRGVIITSETMEEKQLLFDIWHRGANPVVFSKEKDMVSIVIAPIPEEKKEKSD